MRQRASDEARDPGFVSTAQEVKERLITFGIPGLDDENVIHQGERFAYRLENLLSAYPNGHFVLLLLLTVKCIVVFGGIWYYLDRETQVHSESVRDGFFFALQVITAGGADTSIKGPGKTAMFILLLFTGLLIFAILIGLVTEAFQSQMEAIRLGKTKVVEKGHTVVLGWSESTVRLVCQIALLRRQWQMQNETWHRRFFFWRRVAPSTPVAAGRVVIMCTSRTKAEMQDAIAAAFAENGISRRRTCVGKDIVCRVGDPTSVQDLQRMGVQSASAIILQMVEDDVRESERGDIQNAITLQVLLALRFVLFTAKPQPDWNVLRVVTQLAHPTTTLKSAAFTAPNGRPVVIMQDLTIAVNSLLFSCVGRPGLSMILLDLLGFEDEAFKVRKAKDLPHLIGMTAGDVAYHWEDAVFCGIVGDLKPANENKPGVQLDEEHSLVPEASRIIKDGDFIIFVCKSSMPTLVSKKLTPLAGPCPLPEPQRDQDTSTVEKPRRVLVCGWREEWDKASRFAMRVASISLDLPPESHIHFMCKLTADDFSKRMEEVRRVEPNKFSEAGYEDVRGAPCSHCKVGDRVYYKDSGQQFKKGGWALPANEIATVLAVDCDGNVTKLKNPAGEVHDGQYIISASNFVYAKGGVCWHVFGKTKLTHSYGDAADAKDAEPLLANWLFTNAIILSTMADRKLSSQSRDRRLMSILLTLRHIQGSLDQVPMHVAGENALDATSFLAITPSQTGAKSRPPDFVNVHAICACALANCVAYPRMQEAISAILAKVEGAPKMELADASLFGIVGHKLPFSSVVTQVKLANKDNICLGYQSAGSHQLAPLLSSEHEYGEGDTLIILTRELFKKSAVALEIQIVRALNLPKVDRLLDEVDPYCVAEIQGKPHSRITTQTLANVKNPEWKHLARMLDYEEGDSIKFTVWDKDVSGADFLGSACLPSERVQLDGFKGQLPLTDKGQENGAYIEVSVRREVRSACDARSPTNIGPRIAEEEPPEEMRVPLPGSTTP